MLGMKHVPTLIGVLLALAVTTALAFWAYAVSARLGGEGWDWLTPILPFVIVGLLAVGGLTGVLMWLAFYSARRGYDAPYDVNQPRGGGPKRGPKV